MTKKQRIKTTLRFLISSLVVNAENVETSDEDKEILLNEVINVLVNTLQPEYALMLLDELGATAESMRKWI
jgi:hypothetical protein